MPITYEDSAGRTYILDGARYRPMTQEETELAAEGPVKAFGRQAMRGLENTFYGLASVINAPLAMTGNLRAQVTQHGIGEEFQQNAAERQQQKLLFPTATTAGDVAAYGIEAAISGDFIGVRQGLSNVGRGAMRLASRDSRRQASNAGKHTVQELGTVVNDFGMDSAGAAAQGGFWQQLKRMPGMRTMLEGLEEFVGVKRPLSADQARFIENGDVDRVGLQLLPGQAEGNGVISEVIRRDPLLADSLDSITSANSEQLLNKASRAMGLEPGDWGRDIRQLGRNAVGEMFEEVEQGIGKVRIPDELAPQIDEVLSPAERTALNIAEESLEGRDVMDVRRFLADELANAQGPNPQAAARVRQLEQNMEALDDLIEESMSDPALKELWAEARSRWRVVRAFDRQGVITPDGEISVKSLVNALDREFVREFRRTSLTQGQNLPSDVVELLDFARVARTFASNLNDSGTATGNALLQAVASPGQFAKKRLAAKFITDVIVGRPDRVPAT